MTFGNTSCLADTKVVEVIEQALTRVSETVRSQGQTVSVFVGLSGGVDSSVLLHACVQLSHHFPRLKLQAVHVHHGLSENADAWQKHVRALCDQFSIPLISENVTVDSKGSREEAARKARYDVFKQYLQPNDVLLLAHHQDDQIETFMQRLMRGSGLSGLLAMRSERTLSLESGGEARILRPLLKLSKSSLLEYATHHHLQFVEDESNTSDEFDRNYWRLSILPKIEQRYPQYRQSLQASLNALSQEQQSLSYFLDSAVMQIQLHHGALNISALQIHPTDIQCQIIRHWLATLPIFPLPTQSQLMTIVNEVILAQADAEPRFQWHHHEVGRYRDALYLLPRNELIHREISVWQGEQVDLGFACLSVVADNEFGLKPDTYQLAFGNPGIKIKPHRRPNKSYKALLQEAGIPPWYRDYWPVLMKSDRVAAIPGVCICEGFTVQNGWSLQFLSGLNKKHTKKL